MEQLALAVAEAVTVRELNQTMDIDKSLLEKLEISIRQYTVSHGGPTMLPSKERNTEPLWLHRILSVTLIVPLLLMAGIPDGFTAGDSKKITQMTFATPEEAAQALVTAAKNNDAESLAAILGPGAKQLLYSGDEVQDKVRLERFTSAYSEKNELVRKGDTKVVLEVGNDAWPLPIPIMKKANIWFFDTKQAKDEILSRRIGMNELSTIQVCLAYVDAQREYASKDRNGDGVLEYAQRFASDPGKKNGLYWEAKEGEDVSPLGPFIARAKEEGYTKKSDAPAPFHGYYFKILKTQGKNAPRGAYDYVENGMMIGGFAMVAYPAQYGVSGIMTFIISHDGIVYEANLGKKTASISQAMKAFDPGKSWERVPQRFLEPPATIN